MDIKINPDIKIKQEIEDSNENFLKLSFDVDVKVEENDTRDDWSVLDALESSPFHEENSYEELKQENPRKCLFCGKYFINSFSFLQHNLTHLNVPLIQRKIFMCEHCSYYSRNKRDLQNHIHNIHITKQNKSKVPLTKQNHTCMICKKTYRYNHWFCHMKEVHGQLEVKCDKCNMQFKCKRYLTKHIIRRHLSQSNPIQSWHHRYSKEVKCPKCPSILDSKNALTTHLRNCHSKETFTCHLCKSTLKCKSYYLAHMKRVHHNDGIVHECDICGKFFKSLRYLKVHMKNAHMKKAANDKTVSEHEDNDTVQIKEEIILEIKI